MSDTELSPARKTINVAFPLYEIRVWTGIYDKQGNPQMQIGAQFLSLEECAQWLHVAKPKGYSLVLLIELQREGLPLPKTQGNDNIFSPSHGEA